MSPTILALQQHGMFQREKPQMILTLTTYTNTKVSQRASTHRRDIMTEAVAPNRRERSDTRNRARTDDEKRFQRTKEIWTAITAKSLDLRDAEREFHGFQGELRRLGAGIKDQYVKSRAIKHVRDLGAHREELLRIFFKESGLLPFQYALSHSSSRVIGSSGHASKEIDLLFFDRNTNIVLRRFGNTLEFYPAESTLGVIQVKSNLNYAEIDSAFENIASFKKIYRDKEQANTNTDGTRGFGIIFAFESSLTHAQIAKRIKHNSGRIEAAFLPNTIIVLDGSAFRFGDDEGGYLFNNRVDNLENVRLWGDMNVSGDTFYRFYAELMELLRMRKPQRISLESYFDLPLVSDGVSYKFHYGANAETAKCPSHGSYLRRLSAGSAIKVFESIEGSKPIHWIRALDIARGEAGDNIEAYRRQPGEVRIYNPMDLPLSKILLNSDGTLSYDDLIMGELYVWIPWFYVIKESLFGECPSCRKAQKARESRRKKSGIRPNGET